VKRSLAQDHVISRYRLGELLGAGGMGEVYRAWDSALERPIALKILPPQLVQNADRVRRFVQEAKAASSLNHPHIVTIHDVGEESGVHFIAMELIDGETLRTKISSGAPLRDLLRWLAQAADGLAKAHAAGIVHRDLKPENIMITRDGYAKVLDFGLAKLIEPSSPTTAAREVTQVRHDDATREGFVVGTIGYMSPEQVQGQRVDHRSDIFSFGAMLYEAATRRRAFAADSDVDLMHKIVHDNPEPIDRLNPNTPAELRRIVRRCLAKDPDQRIQSMKDLAIDLHEIHDQFETLTTNSDSHSMPTVIVPAMTRRRSWRTVALIAAVVIIAAGLVAWRIRSHAAAPQFTLDKLQIRKLTTSGNVRLAAISPDGKYLAYEVNDDGRFSLRLRQVATGSDLQTVVPHEEDFQGVSFSPDSNYLYFAARETPMSEYSILHSMPILGGPARKLLFDVDSAVTFSPDGKRIAFIRGAPEKEQSNLFVAGADGTNAKILFVGRDDTRFGFTAPAWSPDGKSIAAVTGYASTPHIVIVDVASAKATTLGDAWADLSSLAWMADGSGLFVTAAPQGSGASSQVWFVGYPDGRRSRIFSDLSYYDDVTATADGKTLAAVQVNVSSSLFASAPNGENAKRIAGPESKISAIAVSGDRIVYTVYRPGATQLWSVDTNGTRTQLTTMAPVEWPSATRDGRTILFEATNGGVPHIYAIDADGGNLRQLTRGKSEGLPSVSPDGTWFAYATGDGKIMRQSMSGGAATIVADQTLPLSRVSPDGTSVVVMAWRREANGKTSIELKDVPVNGGASRGSIPWLAERDWDWTPSGDIAYVNWSARRTLWSVSFKGGDPRKLMELPSSSLYAFAFSPDGKQIYTSHTDQMQDAVWLTDFR